MLPATLMYCHRLARMPRISKHRCPAVLCQVPRAARGYV